MQLKRITKQLFWGLGVLTTVLQTPEVSSALGKAVLQHPHLSTLLAAAAIAASIRHNPEVEKALGLEVTQHITTAEVVALAPDQTSTPPARP